MGNRVAIILWFFLSWGLIVATRNPQLNQLVLKVLIPLIVICIVVIERKFIWSNVSLLLYIVFFSWCCLSIVYTANHSMTFRYLQVILGNICVWYAAYRLTVHIKDSDSMLLILGGTFIFHAIMGIITPPLVYGNEEFGRAAGMYKNPNALGFSMWYGIVIFSYFVGNTRQRMYKLLFIVAVLLCIWVMFSTGSRKNVLALLVFFTFLIYYLSKSKFRLSILFFLLIGIFSYQFFLDFLLKETAVGARLIEGTLERGAVHRTELVEEGLNLFFQYPIIGVGLGSFTSFSSSGLMAHNDYIEILSSTGIIGFFIYLPIFWFFYKDCQILRKNRSTFKFAIIASSFLFGYLVLGMGRPAFLDPFSIIVFGSIQSLVLKKKQWTIIQQNQFKANEDLPDHQHAQLGR